MVKDKSGEGSQTAVGLDPINDGVQHDVLQRGRVVILVKWWTLYTEKER